MTKLQSTATEGVNPASYPSYANDLTDEFFSGFALQCLDMCTLLS